MDRGHFTVRKGGGVEPRRVLGVLVEPEADRVFRFHVFFVAPENSRFKRLGSGTSIGTRLSVTIVIVCAELVAQELFFHPGLDYQPSVITPTPSHAAAVPRIVAVAIDASVIPV